MTLPKKISSLDTWSPDDNSFSKHILKEGSGCSTPNDGAAATILLTLLDDKQIEQDDLGEYIIGKETEVTIGEGDTVLSELFDKVVVSMKEEEECYIKANCDFKGNKLKAISNEEAKLKFKIHLYSFSRSADISDLLVDEKLEKADHHKNKGTEIYNKNLHYSLMRFRKSLQFLEATPVNHSNSFQQKQIRTLSLQCHLNLAAGMLKTQQYEEVIKHCSSALQFEPANIKGLFRRAEALHKLHRCREALEDLELALVSEPQNRTVLSLYKCVEASLLKEKLMYQRMFT